MATQSRDTAIQGEIVRLYNEFIYDGVLMNPASQPLVEILDTDGGTVIATVHAEIDTTGRYFAEWFVPYNLPLGNYYDKWTFQWDANAGIQEVTNIFSVYALDTYLNFVSSGKTVCSSNVVAEMITHLEYMILEVQHKPVYFEQGMRTQQDDQQKRRKDFYYFVLDSEYYEASVGDIYFNNGQKFTIREDLIFNSSSSESSSSIDSSSSNSISTSSSSYNHSSSTSSEGNSSSSSIDSSSTTSSSSTSQGIVYDSSDTYVPETILMAVGTGDPSDSGTLIRVEGEGSESITFTSVAMKESKYSTIFDFTFRNWNQNPRPIVRLNGRQIDDGWHADYNGRIYMDGLLAPEDSIEVYYTFSYFSVQELQTFLVMGLQRMNAVPPASTQYGSLVNAPNNWKYAIVLYAAILALRRLVFGLNCQQTQVIFGGPDNINSEDAARAAQEQFKALYTQYLEEWEQMAEDLKSRRLPAIALSIQPEYTLPGGRCMSSDTSIKSNIEGVEKECSIVELYGFIESGKIVEVLGWVNEEIEYCQVSKIWKSGIKETYELSYETGSIRLSEEHLVYSPDSDSYIPVKNMKKGSSVMIYKDGVLIQSKLLKDPELYGEEEVYDMEVPESSNFIGNNILSHNSRWFRYMYK